MSNELEKIAYVYGDVCLRKQRRKRQKLLINELFLDYAKNSTLHGLRYIAEKGLTIIEKLFWVFTFVVSIILCSFLIKNVYMKWKESPVIVTVSERLVSVGEIPFPSVTICPQIKSKASVYNISKEVNYFNKAQYNMTVEEIERFLDVVMVCGLDEFDDEFNRTFTNASIINNIDYVSPSILDALTLCSWHSINIPCDDMFKKVYTAEGLCFNMNGLAADAMFRDNVQKDYKYSERNRTINGWSLDDGYSPTVKNPFPKRGSENGAVPDLEVVLHSRDKDSDGLCNGVNSGYKIYIQHPADFPQSSIYYFAALNRQVSSLALSFNQLRTSNDLENYSIQDRQCYFQKDRSLHYFKMYTAKNCRAECLSNYTFNRCGCVGYYMPHDNSSQICGNNRMNCVRDAYGFMAYKELNFELSKSDMGCRCLPACNTVEYDAEILKTDFHLKRFIKNFIDFDSYFDNTTSFSKIEMFFKKPQFVSMRRSELFGLTDFLANIGGLLGVFLGFSFLSLIEIMYFLTLRVGVSLKRDLREEKKIRANSLKIVQKSN